MNPVYLLFNFHIIKHFVSLILFPIPITTISPAGEGGSVLLVYFSL